MRQWLAWALTGFPALESMPWPLDYDTVVCWRHAFLLACVNLSPTCRQIALFLADFTGADPKSARLRSRDYTLHQALMNADNGNREGLCRVIRHPRLW